MLLILDKNVIQEIYFPEGSHVFSTMYVLTYVSNILAMNDNSQFRVANVVTVHDDLLTQ